MLSLEGVKDCREVAWEYALTSQMNVDYYQRRVDRLVRWDTSIRLVSGVAASFTIGTFLRESQVGWGIDVASILGAIAAGCTLIGATLRIPDKARALGVLLGDYVTLARRFEDLYQFGCTEETLKQALSEFHRTEQSEAKEHPWADPKELEKSRATVMARLTPASRTT